MTVGTSFKSKGQIKERYEKKVRFTKKFLKNI